MASDASTLTAAGRVVAIDERYHMVDGHPKRFFERDDVTALFATGWRTLGMEELDAFHSRHRPAD